jgi:hypothetical protein
LGAGRERLIRQLVTESLVLAVLEGVPGALGAFHSVPLPAKLVPDSLPMAQTPSVDWRVLTFAALLTVITRIGFGVIRALPTGGGVNLAGMREGVRAGGGQREALRVGDCRGRGIGCAAGFGSLVPAGTVETASHRSGIPR